MHNPIAEVNKRVSNALKFRLDVAVKSGVRIENGLYVADKCCTLLEAIVLGEEASGDMTADAAAALKVSKEWIEGFMAGINYRNPLVRRD